MDEQKHTINRHVLELTVTDRDQALSIQNNTSNLIKNKLIPALDQMFSKLTTQDEILRIDRLVLDIGDISASSFDEEMISKTVEELEHRLTEIIYQKKTGQADNSGRGDDDQIPAVFVSKPESLQEQLIHYLKFGVLPWWREEKAQLNLDQLIQQVTEEKKEIASEVILPLMTFNQVKRRIAFQLDEPQFTKFLSLLPVDKKQLAVETYKSLEPGKLRMDWEAEALLRYHFLDLVSKQKQLYTDEVMQKFLELFIDDYMKNKSSSERKALIENFIPFVIESSLSKEVKKRIIRFVVQLTREMKLTIKVIEIPGIAALLDKKEIEKARRESSEEGKKENETREIIPGSDDKSVEVDEAIEITMADKKEEAKEEVVGESVMKRELDEEQKEEFARAAGVDDEEAVIEKSTKEDEYSDDSHQKKFRLNTDQMEIFVNNAGLVLLHPFLFYFFDGLGLMNKNKTFKSEEDAYRGVHLLQYLATGEKATPEHELSLNKILCGMDIDDPVPFKVRLKKKEIEECINLQSVVLERWEVLKTTNTEALREGFLQREGRLSNRGNGWHIFIERETLDIMLDRLPWSISIISLPWRNDLIYVEW